MIFTANQLQSSSYKFINKLSLDDNYDVNTIKSYISHYGKLSHEKIRNIKLGGKYQSQEEAFIDHCIMQYEFFRNIDYVISYSYKCLIAGASHIIEENVPILEKSITKSKEFLNKEEK